MNKLVFFKSVFVVLIISLWAIRSSFGQLAFMVKDPVRSGNNNLKVTNIANVDDNDFMSNSVGLQVGLGFGLYLPGNESANYYNGKGKNNVRRMVIDNIYIYKELKEALVYDFTLDSNNLPSNMKYTPAVALQVVSKYNFNENNGFVLDVNYAKLTASDFFTLTLADPHNLTSEPTTELCKIWGIEERVSFNFGYFRSFGKPKKIKPFVEIGVNVNDTKLKDNKVQILGYTYSIVDQTDSYYGVKQGGIGHGFYFSPGVLFNIRDAFSAQLGADLSLKKINLLANPEYSKEIVFFIRLMYKNVFGGKA